MRRAGRALRRRMRAEHAPGWCGAWDSPVTRAGPRTGPSPATRPVPRGSRTGTGRRPDSRPRGRSQLRDSAGLPPASLRCTDRRAPLGRADAATLLPSTPPMEGDTVRVRVAVVVLAG